MASKPSKKRRSAKGNIPKIITAAASTSSLAQIKQQAMELIQANRYPEAQQLYEEAVETDLADASVYANLGALLQIAGRGDDSIPILEKSIALQPGNAVALLNMGNALQGAGRTKEAINAFRAAISIDSSLPEAHTGLGVALHVNGEINEAILQHREALALRSAYPEAWSNLGYSLLHQADSRQEAIAACHEALRLRPDYAEAHSNLGLALHTDGQLEAGLASLRKAIALGPSLPNPHLLLADALRELNRLPEAITLYQRCIELKPNSHKALTGLAKAHKDNGDLAEGLRIAEQALAIQPDWANASWIKIEILDDLGRATDALEASEFLLKHCQASGQGFLAKGVLLEKMKRYTEAHAALAQALKLDPTLYPAYYCRGWMFAREGKVQEAIDDYHQVLKLRPAHYEGAAAVFYTELFCRGDQGERIRNEAEQYWNQAPRPQISAFKYKPLQESWPNSEAPIRLLLISGDIGDHAVSCFLEPLLRGLDRQHFQLILALTHRRREPRAQALELLADEVLNLTGLGEEAAVEALRAKACAVAIDAAGWTSKNALSLLRHRVAPVQCHYVGFCGTTGLNTIDYMIGDAILTPAKLQNQFTEKIWPLQRCWSTFSPTFEPPAICERAINQPIIFGSFNNLVKFTDRCADFWAEALREVSGSQLLLKDSYADVPIVRERVERALENRGVAPRRITFLTRVANWHEHMALYNRVDIAFDTTPMTSATTGFEALCMGVPLLAIQTDWMGGRMSSSTLTAIGREGWIARDPSSFAANAKQLASAILSQPNGLKQGLREQFLASPLSDTPSLCRELEQAFIQMLTEHSKPMAD